MLLPLALPVAFTILTSFYLLVKFFYQRAKSPLRHLPGPPSPSYFFGQLREIIKNVCVSVIALDALLIA